MFQDIKASLQQFYREDERPWLVGFSGGKDRHPSADGLASLIFDAVLAIPAEQTARPVYRMPSTVFTIPAIAEMIEGTLDGRRKCCERKYY